MDGRMQKFSPTIRAAVHTLSRALFLGAILLPKPALAQVAFDVSVIHPSSAEVKFERNGKTEVAYGTLRMHDVTLSTCLQWDYDITAKTDPSTTQDQMRVMLRTLLADRFKLTFHTEKRELRVYTLTIAKSGTKMHPSAPNGHMFRENSATGMVARSISMKELADYLSDPLDAPLTDGTGLPGRYDFTIDFTPYVDMERNDVRPDPAAVLKAALKGDLGLDLLQRKEVLDVMVVDHLGPPSSN
jgi:hypothetical protein